MNIKFTNTRAIKICLLTLVIIAAAVCIRSLIWDRNTPVGLPDVKDLPKTTGEKIGKNVSTSILALSQEIDGPVPFLYIYDPDTNQDRLMVFQLPKILFPSMESTDNENYWLSNSKVSLATIFEPNWYGLDGFVDGVTAEAFHAKVIHTVYVSNVETGNVLSEIYSSEFHDEEIICLTEQLPTSIASGLQIYCGQLSPVKPETHLREYWTDMGNGYYLYLIGNITETKSVPLQEAISPYYAIASRYDLYPYLPGFEP